MDRDDFEYWLAEMDDALDRLIALLPPTVASRLDFSVSSLDALESWWLNQAQSAQQAAGPAQAMLTDLLARYLGEVIRRQSGAQWTIRYDDPRYAFHGIPIINDQPVAHCPLALVTAAADRRTGRFWSSLASHSNR